MSEMPEIVKGYLERHNYVALPRDRYQELLDEAQERRDERCPYPLHRDHFGHWNHRRHVGTICEDENEFMSGLHVEQCEACGHVTFHTPVALA